MQIEQTSKVTSGNRLLSSVRRNQSFLGTLLAGKWRQRAAPTQGAAENCGYREYVLKIARTFHEALHSMAIIAICRFEHLCTIIPNGAGMVIPLSLLYQDVKTALSLGKAQMLTELIGRY